MVKTSSNHLKITIDLTSSFLKLWYWIFGSVLSKIDQRKCFLCTFQN